MKAKSLAAGLFLAFLAVTAAQSQPASDAPKAGAQQPEKLDKQVTRVVKLNYLLYVPPEYGKEPEKKWPLIIFLHGSAERGHDLNALKGLGLPKVVEKRQLPFVVASPQCPSGQWWKPDDVIALTDEVIAKYKCDPDRVYLTGLSMGGLGTWDTAMEYPDRFAAIAPVCGWGNPFRAPDLKNVPVWAFHGEQDRSVPIGLAANVVSVLKQVGGDVRFTRYPQADHDAWTPTYDNRELYAWFLQHKRGDRK